jgi:hypothetical protein
LRRLRLHRRGLAALRHLPPDREPPPEFEPALRVVVAGKSALNAMFFSLCRLT